MKNPISLSIRNFALLFLGMCLVLLAGFLALRGLPRSLWPTLIVAGISFVAGITCVLFAGLLLLLAVPIPRDPQSNVASNQQGSGEHYAPRGGFRAVSSDVEKLQPLGTSAGLSTIQPTQDAPKKGLRVGDEDEEKRAA